VVRLARIVGTGSYLPERVMDNVAVSRGGASAGEAILRRTGIRMRRWACEEETTSLLAARAAREACLAADVNPGTLEAIIVSTTSPDTVFPATACHLQRHLGSKGTAAFDVAASCSGFLYGLSMADRLIRSGQYGRCLVVAAEIKSRFLDPEDETTAILFGDGAGAAVLVGEENREGPYADGSRAGLIQVPAGGSRQPATLQSVKDGQHTLRMRGGPLFRVAVRRMAEAVAEILKEFGLDVDQVGHAIFHQANGRLLAAVARRLRLPAEKVFTVIERFGNASSASLPIALDQANCGGRLRRGEVVLLGAFGGGLTWASALVRW
jgi:3-oxoacyl-[acyl-carrier-protein] synthase-3